MTTSQSGAPETTPEPHGGSQTSQEPFQVARLKIHREYQSAVSDGELLAQTCPAEGVDLARRSLLDQLDRAQRQVRIARGRLEGFTKGVAAHQGALTSENKD